MNFVEFYPPISHAMTLAFPKASGIEGGTWRAKETFDMARAVLKRGRRLGVRFMYVLTYGAFVEQVSKAFPELEWADHFLCAYQPELKAMTTRLWKILIDELGTDHIYALRHRGEESQSYSNPCRSLTKAQGMSQALSIFEELDPGSRVTVWTWSEKVPVLFGALPQKVEAVHIRHGLGKVFSSAPEGREQPNGAAADMPSPRRWFSAQFTVFGGHETLLQTAWCDSRVIVEDARVSARDPLCQGFFQWPEWSGTSPWLSHFLSELSWDPDSFDSAEVLHSYAQRRHGSLAQAFLDGFTPFVQAGNAPYMIVPNKRLMIPYRLEKSQLAPLARMLQGLEVMESALRGTDSPALLFERDLIDLATLVGVRLAQSWEIEACLRHSRGEGAGAEEAVRKALDSWSALERLLAQVPERSLIETARLMASEGPLGKLGYTFWFHTEFYNGYPLVWSAEGIRGVYRPQCEALLEEIKATRETGVLPSLRRMAAWFWRDFPDPSWKESVRKMPDADLDAFEQQIKAAFEEAIQRGSASSSDYPITDTSRLVAGEIPPSALKVLDRAVVLESVRSVVGLGLPPALSKAPVWPKVDVVFVRGEIKILEKILFDDDSAIIQKKSHSLLDEVAATIIGAPSIKKLEIQGHTDDVGNDRSNEVLSSDRAKSVRTYLIGAGVNADVLSSKGYGGTSPLKPVKGLEGEELRDARAANRRVQLKILE